MPFSVTLKHLYYKPGFDENDKCPCGGDKVLKKSKKGGSFIACSDNYCYNTEKRYVAILREYQKLFAWEEDWNIIDEIDLEAPWEGNS